MKPSKSERIAQSKKDGPYDGRLDVYDGSKDEPHSHDVFHTSADGVTTHDYGRTADGIVYINTPPFEGNVISGGDQYDAGYTDWLASFDPGGPTDSSS